MSKTRSQLETLSTRESRLISVHPYTISLGVSIILCMMTGGVVQAQESLPPAFRTRLLRQFDADRDGRLSQNEQARLRQQLRRGDSVRRNRELFKFFDTDGDGQLNQQELARARRRLGQAALGRAEPQNGRRAQPRNSPIDFSRPDIISRFDRNDDGMLDREERAAARRAIQRQAAQRRAGQRRSRNVPNGPQVVRPTVRLDQTNFLRRFDADGNGMLNVSERAAALRALRDSS